MANEKQKSFEVWTCPNCEAKNKGQKCIVCGTTKPLKQNRNHQDVPNRNSKNFQGVYTSKTLNDGYNKSSITNAESLSKAKRYSDRHPSRGMIKQHSIRNSIIVVLICIFTCIGISQGVYFFRFSRWQSIYDQFLAASEIVVEVDPYLSESEARSIGTKINALDNVYESTCCFDDGKYSYVVLVEDISCKEGTIEAIQQISGVSSTETEEKATDIFISVYPQFTKRFAPKPTIANWPVAIREFCFACKEDGNILLNYYLRSAQYYSMQDNKELSIYYYERAYEAVQSRDISSTETDIHDVSRSDFIVPSGSTETNTTTSIDSLTETDTFSRILQKEIPQEYYSGHSFDLSTLHIHTLKTPDQSGWNADDIDPSSFTSTFDRDVRISLALENEKNFYLDDETIEIKFVFVDYDNKTVLSFPVDNPTSWNDIWYDADYHWGELDIPAFLLDPGDAGNYTLYICFNSTLLGTIPITIT